MQRDCWTFDKLEQKIANCRGLGAGCNRKEFRFIGGLGLSVGDIVGNIAGNNCEDWFKGTNVHYVHSARTAIRKALAIINLPSGGEILVPSYHCGSEIDALLHAGAKVRLFRVSRTGEIDAGDLRNRITPDTKAIYAIHYFGFAQQLSSVAELCRSKRLYLIEDCALSTFSEVESRRIGRLGDVAVYNFPKVVPVPDGGALVINNPALQLNHWQLQQPSIVSIVAGVLRLLKPSVLRRAPAALTLFWRKGNGFSRPAPGLSRPQIPRSYYFSPAMMNRRMSSVSRRIIKRTDLSQVREQRRRNFSLLLDSIPDETGVAPLLGKLPVGVCPLCFPVVVPDAREVARRLRALSVPAIAWWSGYHRERFDWNEFNEAAHLKDHVVALPVHHQLDEAAMRFIASKFVECFRAA